MQYIIDFIIDFTNKLYFDNASDMDKERFNPAKDIYLHGGCYELAKIIASIVPDVSIYCDTLKEHQHCVIKYDGILYDAEGIVSQKEQYRLANEDDKKEMEEEFGKYVRGLNLFQNIVPYIVKIGVQKIIQHQMEKTKNFNTGKKKPL